MERDVTLAGSAAIWNRPLRPRTDGNGRVRLLFGGGKVTVPLYLDRDDVCSLLDMPGCIAAVRRAMIALAIDEIEQPLRQIVEMGPSELFATMAGTLPGTRSFGAKLVTVFGDPDRAGRSRHAGLAILFEGESGGVSLIADAGAVTEIRTGAASAVATDALARPDARTLSLFGCGVQARAHLRAMAEIRPLDSVFVWGRSGAAAEAFASRMADETGLNVRAVSEGAEAAGLADIICTVTGAETPVLFSEWVRPGTHINVVGSSHAGPTEIDSSLVVRSRYFVDSRRAVEVAGAEFIIARGAGLVTDAHILGEIGAVLSGTIPGRIASADVTIYKSLGHVAQDLAALEYLRHRGGKGPSDAVQAVAVTGKDFA